MPVANFVDRTPKFGNDDDYADGLMTRVFESYFQAVDGRPTPRGGKYRSSRLVLANGREATDDVRYALEDGGKTFVAEEKFRARSSSTTTSGWPTGKFQNRPMVVDIGPGRAYHRFAMRGPGFRLTYLFTLMLLAGLLVPTDARPLHQESLEAWLAYVVREVMPTAAQDFAPVRGPMSQGPGVTGTTAYNFKGRVPAGWDGLILIFEMPMAYRCMFTAWPSYAQIRDAKPRAALYKAIQKSLNGFLKDSWKRSEEKKKHVWTQEGQTTTTEWSGSAGLRVSLTRREKLYKGDPVIPEVTLSISLRR